MNEQLGKLIEGVGARDAVHVAVAPVIAKTALEPGQHIGLIINNQAGVCAEPIGIVDPFLTETLQPGAAFYIVLYPNTITSLEHRWIHPAFEEVETAFENASTITPAKQRQRSMRWLIEFGEDINIEYEKLLVIAKDWVDDKNNDGWGEYYIFRGEDTPSECHENAAEMWFHLRNVVDYDIPFEIKDDCPFSCSC